MEKDGQRMHLLYGDGTQNGQIISNGSPSSLTVDNQGNKYSTIAGRRGLNPQAANFLIQPQQQQQQQQQHASHVPYTPPPPGLTSIQQHVSSGQYSPYNLNNTLPPGLPTSSAGPPGFFFPPQQQQNLYHGGQFGSPQPPMTMYSMQQQQQQGLYSTLYIPPPPMHDANLNVNKSQEQQLEDYEISQRLNMLLDVAVSTGGGGSSGRGCSMENVIHLGAMQQQGNGSLSPSPNMMSGGGYNNKLPIIENIVGSMSMPTGTYTHFGPSVAMTGGIAGQGSSTSVSSIGSVGGVCSSKVASVQAVGNISPSSFIPSPTSIQQQQQNEMKILQSSLLKDVNMREKIGIVHPRVIGKESPGVDKLPQRAATPKEGTDSRPQTPGKLSYSEVLTKNQPNQGNNAAFQKAPSVPSSNASSVLASAYRMLDNGQLIPTSTTATIIGTSRRTSAHNLQGDFTTASNSSSSSSSPVTRPKVPSNSSSYTANGLTRSNSKGKENSSSSTSSSKSSTTKTTPNVTPTHVGGGPLQNCQQQQVQKTGKTERKVLGSNLLNGINSTLAGGSPSGNYPGKNQTKIGAAAGVTTGMVKNNSKTFQFEFDIEDLDDVHDKGSVNGNKSAKRGSGSGVSSGSSNGKPSSNKIYLNGVSPSSGNGNVTSGVEKKTGLTNGSVQAVSSSVRKNRDKNEKVRSRKEDRNCMVRRMRRFNLVQRVRLVAAIWISSIWINLISAVNWLWSLVVNVGTLSCSLAFTLLEDFYSWWRSNGIRIRRDVRNKVCSLWHKVRLKIPWWKGKGAEPESSNSYFGQRGKNDEILSMMGPERNIMLPSTGEDALKRLLSVKGQDPYSILGIRSDSSDVTVRRYYKRQAVLVHPDKLVHPGAEEAFKILARAFELVGEPAKRIEYHRQLLRAHEKERVFGEIGNLLEQLRKKMESVTNTIRCTKCNSRHKKVRTDRPLFAARYCTQCRINHAAREGDLWAERGKGFFGLSWHMYYYTCMENSVWEVNEWASCQKKNLVHLVPNAHNIMYRLVAGAGKNNSRSGGSKDSQSGGFDESHGSSAAQEDIDQDFDDDWDTLINNLCRSTANSSSNSSGTSSSNNKNNSNSSSTGSSKLFNDLGAGGSGNVPNSSNSSGLGGGGLGNTSRRRGKVKR